MICAAKVLESQDPGTQNRFVASCFVMRMSWESKSSLPILFLDRWIYWWHGITRCLQGNTPILGRLWPAGVLKGLPRMKLTLSSQDILPNRSSPTQLISWIMIYAFLFNIKLLVENLRCNGRSYGIHSSYPCVVQQSLSPSLPSSGIQILATCIRK